MMYNGYEVHLIDSPGFDDSMVSDHQVLHQIADFVNHIYSFDWNIGGIIYLYDISRAKMAAGGKLNIRMLEQFTGRDRWKHITLVTSKWGCFKGGHSDLKHERQLREKDGFWKQMLTAGYPARMARFDDTQESALAIIESHLGDRFVPEISRQMVDTNLELGRTDAGELVKISAAQAMVEYDQQAQLVQLEQIMRSKFDGLKARYEMEAAHRQMLKLQRKADLARAGRIALRLAMYAGITFVSLAAENPRFLQSALKAAIPIETALRMQKKKTNNQIEVLRDRISEYSAVGNTPRIVELL